MRLALAVLALLVAALHLTDPPMLTPTIPDTAMVLDTVPAGVAALPYVPVFSIDDRVYVLGTYTEPADTLPLSPLRARLSALYSKGGSGVLIRRSPPSTARLIAPAGMHRGKALDPSGARQV